MLPHLVEGRLELPVAIDRDHGAGFRGLVKGLPEPGERAAHARAHERARAGELQQQHLVHPSLPVAPRPLPQMASCEQPGLVVVGPEVGGAGMGHVDGDERDASLHVRGGDGRRDGFVRLEFDDEIDAFANQVLGGSEGHLRLVAVVEHDQLDILAIGGALEAREHLARKRGVLALAGIADPVPPAPSNLRREAIPRRVDLLDHSDVVEGVQQAEAQPLAETGALDDVAEPQRLA